jgi:spore maturation protein CgeB
MRLFEATGAGTCLLTDWKENLKDFFELDKEVSVFKSNEECLEKILYLLEHEDERKAIAQAGQKRTLTEYSYNNVLGQFTKYLEAHLR